MENSENKIEDKKNINWKKILWRTGAAIFIIFAILVITRMPYVYEKRKTEEQVAKIHATKLTMDDVMGVNLPPDPGEAADDTVEGIDANKNGIRDDVELSIFKEYPDSAKTRAVLLQYALALQMEMTQPIVNTEIVIAVAQERSKAATCIGDVTSRDDMNNFVEITMKYNDFIKKKQINTQIRNQAEADFLKHIGSYADLSNDDCDINLKELPN